MTASLTLSHTERAVLLHVQRYNVTVPEAVARTVPQSRGSHKVARRLLRELLQQDQLQTHPLYYNRKYYRLTPEAARCLQPRDDNQDTADTAFSELSKTRAYAMLAFCCLGSRRRERLTPDEFRTYFPTLFRPGLVMNYYVDTAGKSPRLGFLRVDVGGHGRWDRIVEKLREDVRAHAAQPPFRQIIEQSAFEITLATALAQKADRVRATLAQHRDTQTIPIHVVAIPELLYLIAPPPLGNNQQTAKHSANGGFDSLPVPGARKNNGCRELSCKP
jgi:hypothetical protein